jgi:hypothetical protein
MLEISEAGSDSIAASDRGLGRPVASEVELRSRAARLKPSLIWIEAVGIEDGNYEKVTTRMHPSVIVWIWKPYPTSPGLQPRTILSASPTWKSARQLATSFRSTSTTRSSASVPSSRTGSRITGRWTPKSSLNLTMMPAPEGTRSLDVRATFARGSDA